ncbi:MAG: hypothetical protein ACJ77M_01415 [Thermoleophilaceae bacterium]
MPSKLVAGGLSAAVVLLWWPRFFPADSVESWLVRGIVWTLCFEVMLLSFRPLEEALWDTPGGRRLHGKAAAASRVLGAESPRRRLGASGIVASLALAAPVVALLLGPPHRPQPSQVTRHVTEVRQIVRVVRKKVVAQAPATPSTAPVAPMSPGPAQAGSRRHAAAAPRPKKSTKSAPTKRAPQPSTGSTTQQPQQTQQATPQTGAGAVATHPVAG